MKKIFSCFFIIFLVTFTGHISAQNCITDQIVFSTQSQVDSFQYHYPGCNHIMGKAIVSGNSINNLYGLNVLTAIDGNLEINSTQYLPSLTGLDNLTYIGGDLIILNNQALTGLAGLHSLATVGGSISITDNETLMSLSDLISLETGTLADLTIHDNPALFDCDIQGICDYLSAPNGHVDIYNNFPGCENPPDIAEDCGFTMSCLPYGDYYFMSQSDINSFQSDYPACSSLEGTVTISGEDIHDLSGLDNVTSMGMYVKIESNEILPDLEGLESLTHVYGSLYIWGNESLSSLEGLENLSYIEGNLTLYHNPGLTNLDPLQNLSHLGNMLEIGYNDNLSDITALSQITSIGEMLWVGFNNSLTSLSGLDNIDPESFSHLVIVFNPLLSECEVLSVCQFIAGQGGIIQVQDNGVGCDTQQEILDECAVGVEDADVPKGIVTIYPNPARDVINIESSEKIQSVTIFDSRGIPIEQWNNGTMDQTNERSGDQAIGHLVELPVSGLSPGLYLVRVVTARGVVTGKVVVGL